MEGTLGRVTPCLLSRSIQTNPSQSPPSQVSTSSEDQPITSQPDYVQVYSWAEDTTTHKEDFQSLGIDINAVDTEVGY